MIIHYTWRQGYLPQIRNNASTLRIQGAFTYSIHGIKLMISTKINQHASQSGSNWCRMFDGLLFQVIKNKIISKKWRTILPSWNKNHSTSTIFSDLNSTGRYCKHIIIFFTVLGEHIHLAPTVGMHCHANRKSQLDHKVSCTYRSILTFKHQLRLIIQAIFLLVT